MKNKFMLLTLAGVLLCGCNNTPATNEEPKIESVSNLECVSNLEHEDGALFINNQYSYFYASSDSDDSVDGWIVKLTDKESTDSATSEICETVDGLPIVSAYGMYMNSQASTIDISTLKSDNVEFMKSMFENTKITNIIGLDKLDTSKVKDMSYMFSNTKLGNYDVKNFDTSNVTNMNYMFYMTNSKDYHIENFKFNEDLQAYGMFDENDNGKPNVYVNNQDRDK